MKPGRWMVLVLIAGLLTAFVFFDLGELFRLERIKAEQEHLVELLHAHPVAFTLGFFLTYVVATAVSVPGAATTLTLVAGALFGLLWGLLLGVIRFNPWRDPCHGLGPVVVSQPSGGAVRETAENHQPGN